jgi:hypothetical protein
MKERMEAGAGAPGASTWAPQAVARRGPSLESAGRAHTSTYQYVLVYKNCQKYVRVRTSTYFCRTRQYMQKFIMVHGSTWRYMEVHFQSLSLFMVVHGGTLQYKAKFAMTVYWSTWWCIAVHANFCYGTWQYMTVHCSTRQSLSQRITVHDSTWQWGPAGFVPVILVLIRTSFIACTISGSCFK